MYLTFCLALHIALKKYMQIASSKKKKSSDSTSSTEGGDPLSGQMLVCMIHAYVSTPNLLIKLLD